MRRILGLMLVLVLAMPAISFAGSATSRWDLTVGGTVKFDVGWSDSKAPGLLGTAGFPARDSANGYQTEANKYGNWLWGAGETGLNFGVRGPDAWGAKTRAYVSGDFIGAWGGTTYGSFDLMLAYLNFDWPNTSLMIGQAGSMFGMLPTFGYNIGWGSLGYGGKGAAPVAPGITLTQMFGKDWTAKIGLLSQQDGTSAINSLGSGAPTSYTRSSIPFIHGGIQYAGPALGKVGPWQLTAGISGAYGQEKRTFATNAASTQWDDKTLDCWYGDFKFLVPIIAEKNGNKTGAFYFDGLVFTEQNLGGGYLGGYAGTAGVSSILSYVRSGSLGTTEFAAPVGYGYYLHAAYYFTDQLWMNGFYSYSGVNTSAAFKTRFPDAMKSAYQYTANIMYDVSPAIRFAFQYEFTKKTFSGPAAVTPERFKEEGTRSVYHVAAYYYF